MAAVAHYDRRRAPRVSQGDPVDRRAQGAASLQSIPEQPIEQDHRAIKQRYYPMRGFGSFASAAQFCAAFDELRRYFRAPRRPGLPIPLATQRRLFVARWRSLIQEMQVV